MKKHGIISLLISAAVLLSICSCTDTSEKGTVVIKDKSDSEVVSAKEDSSKKVPELCGVRFDTALHEKLMNEGYILSTEFEYSDSVPADTVISQEPVGGSAVTEKGVRLSLVISLGKEPSADTVGEAVDAGSDTNGSVTDGSEAESAASIGLTAPSWIISPSAIYDSVETFGKTGYSIFEKQGRYGITDINGRTYGSDYSGLFYCEVHGLSCPDITEETVIAEGLTLVPDCGFRASDKDKSIYVYDDSRSRVYLTGYSDGKFKIADITDTEFFRTNSSYIAVLYNCDADILMYNGIGMESLEEIFVAENIPMRYGVVNNEFVTVLEFVYDSVRDGNDCFIVESAGKYGYRGLSGQHYYECIFDKANTAYKGAAWVKYGGKWGTVAF